MNAPAAFQKIRIRAADLNDPDECRWIESYVRGKAEGTPFHLPQWLKAVEKGCGQKAHMLLAEAGGGDARSAAADRDALAAIRACALVSSGFGVAGGILAERPQDGPAAC